jgi:hypothetical protein
LFTGLTRLSLTDFAQPFGKLHGANLHAVTGRSARQRVVCLLFCSPADRDMDPQAPASLEFN